MVKAVSHTRLNDLPAKFDIHLISIYYFLDFKRRTNLLEMHTSIEVSSSL